MNRFVSTVQGCQGTTGLVMTKAIPGGMWQTTASPVFGLAPRTVQGPAEAASRQHATMVFDANEVLARLFWLPIARQLCVGTPQPPLRVVNPIEEQIEQANVCL